MQHSRKMIKYLLKYHFGEIFDCLCVNIVKQRINSQVSSESILLRCANSLIDSKTNDQGKQVRGGETRGEQRRGEEGQNLGQVPLWVFLCQCILLFSSSQNQPKCQKPESEQEMNVEADAAINYFENSAYFHCCSFQVF